LRNLANLPNLTNLGLSYSNISDVQLAHILTPLKSLESLCVSWNQNLGVDFLEQCIALPHLIHLDLNGLKAITYSVLQDFLSRKGLVDGRNFSIRSHFLSKH
jgi:Leucine-rich repeat (LRR) protein